ncbi:MAG: CoA transferase [Chloroflexi bacterium]|nr:CoA transferase [Chloroflexota bacterium]
MAKAGSAPAALGDIRVLDLADQMGVYCGKLLADLGAEVIKVERPGGDVTRSIGPFFHDEPGPEKSLNFFHFNANKRSVTLNLETSDGRELFRKLVQTADAVIETFPPGYLDSLGLGYAELSKVNPRLILCSITGFGQYGPHKDFKAPDIVGTAMGGLMYLGGFMGEAPNYPGANQGYHLASTDAANGILTALYVRDFTGEGQHVDVSLQESVSRSIELLMVSYDLRKIDRKRTGRQVYRGWDEVFEASDGYILCSPLGGGGWRNILAWMVSEGKAADLETEKMQLVLTAMADRQMDRGVTDHKRLDPRMLRDYTAEIKHIEQVWADFVKSHTREELYEECQRRGVRLMPVYSAEDVLKDPQLLARDFFVDIDYPELGAKIKDVGVPYRLSKTPATVRRRAPLIGEDNLEIYEKELGISRRQLRTLKEEGAI